MCRWFILYLNFVADIILTKKYFNSFSSIKILKLFLIINVSVLIRKAVAPPISITLLKIQIFQFSYMKEYMVCKDPKFFIISTMKQMKEAVKRNDLKTYEQLKRRFSTIYRSLQVPIDLDNV